MNDDRPLTRVVPTFFADEKNYNVRQLESIYERFTDEEVKNINDCIFSLHRLTSDSAFQMLVEKVDDDLKNESDDQHICAGPSTVEH